MCRLVHPLLLIILFQAQPPADSFSADLVAYIATAETQQQDDNRSNGIRDGVVGRDMKNQVVHYQKMAQIDSELIFAQHTKKLVLDVIPTAFQYLMGDKHEQHACQQRCQFELRSAIHLPHHQPSVAFRCLQHD